MFPYLLQRISDKIIQNKLTAILLHRGVKFKISRIPLIGLETRLGWRTDRTFLRNPNFNEINFQPLHAQSPNFSQMFIMESQWIVISFQSNLKSKMGTMFYEWQIHFYMMQTFCGCVMLWASLSICRHNGFHANKCVLVDQSFWNCSTQTPLIVIKVGSCSPIHLVWFMVFNAIFNNISVISWRSILLVEVTRENHWPKSLKNFIT